jgi:glycosyltransferase involved in cell wall biosynthesis
MTSRKPFVVACIPAHNEEDSIAKVIIKTAKHVDRVIVCDDGSTDMTAEIAMELGAEVIKHDRNMGYGASLRSLFSKARELDADVMVTLDADGQHDPDAVPLLVKPVLDGEADMVIGSRFLDGESEACIPGYRRNGIELITRMTKAASYSNITDAQSGYRAYNRRAISLIDPVEQGMGVSTEILLKAKEQALSAAEVPVVIKYDKNSSTQNPFVHGLNVVLSTVKYLSMRRPLLFFGVPGFVALVVSGVFWAWTLQAFAETRAIITNVAIIAIGATMVGLMLLTTALLLWVLVSLIKQGNNH